MVEDGMSYYQIAKEFNIYTGKNKDQPYIAKVQNAVEALQEKEE
jgi:hypothetical protein